MQISTPVGDNLTNWPRLVATKDKKIANTKKGRKRLFGQDKRHTIKHQI